MNFSWKIFLFMAVSKITSKKHCQKHTIRRPSDHHQLITFHVFLPAAAANADPALVIIVRCLSTSVNSWTAFTSTRLSSVQLRPVTNQLRTLTSQLHLCPVALMMEVEILDSVYQLDSFSHAHWSGMQRWLCYQSSLHIVNYQKQSSPLKLIKKKPNQSQILRIPVEKQCRLA